jgi:hypothetical protein
MRNYLPYIDIGITGFEYVPEKQAVNKVSPADNQEMILNQSRTEKYVKPVGELILTALGLPTNSKQAKETFKRN